MLSSDNICSKPKAKSIKSRHQFLFCPVSYTSGQCSIAVTLAFTCNSKQPQPRDVVITKPDLGNAGRFISSCGDEENGIAEVSWVRTIKFLPTTDTHSISSGAAMSAPVNQTYDSSNFQNNSLFLASIYDVTHPSKEKKKTFLLHSFRIWNGSF